MLADKDIVTSLRRLTVPEELQNAKVCLSAATSKHQVFICSERTIRNHTVNFFRELLFIPQTSSELSFRIYSLHDAGRKTLLKELNMSGEDLSILSFKPTSIILEDMGFQLFLDLWMFTEQSQDLNSLTDRDYSELNLTFDNKEESSLTTTIPNPYIHADTQQDSAIKVLQIDQRARKLALCQFQKANQSIRESGKLHLNCKKVKNAREGNQTCSKSTVKTNVCEKLVKELSDLFF